MSNLTPLYLIQLEGVPIYEQLLLEEKLLRTGQDNFCLINYRAPKALVLGISNKTSEHIAIERLPQDLPVIRRYSGGGSVVIDEDTLFVSFIFNKEDLPQPMCPSALMRWNAEILRQAFDKVPLELKENDLVVGAKKCVGNAQYFQKHRVCHHATLLYDYQDEIMNYLAHPPKVPKYRQNRSHAEFLCALTPYFSGVEEMNERLSSYLEKRYDVTRIEVQDLDLKKNCRIATKELNTHKELS